jgi:hypothetical protein
MIFSQDLYPVGSINYQLAQSAIASVMRHLWYLTADTVVFALFDDDLEEQEKREIADALVQTPRVHIRLGKPSMPTHLMVGNPRLSSFVGSQSWKLWDLLGIGSDWLQLPVDDWEDDEEFTRARDYVKGLSVVNDAAERCIKSITDYAAATQDSVYREDILLVGNSHREVFQDLRRAALAGLH